MEEVSETVANEDLKHIIVYLNKDINNVFNHCKIIIDNNLVVDNIENILYRYNSKIDKFLARKNIILFFIKNGLSTKKLSIGGTNIKIICQNDDRLIDFMKLTASPKDLMFKINIVLFIVLSINRYFDKLSSKLIEIFIVFNFLSYIGYDYITNNSVDELNDIDGFLNTLPNFNTLSGDEINKYVTMIDDKLSFFELKNANYSYTDSYFPQFLIDLKNNLIKNLANSTNLKDKLYLIKQLLSYIVNLIQPKSSHLEASMDLKVGFNKAYLIYIKLYGVPEDGIFDENKIKDIQNKFLNGS